MNKQQIAQSIRERIAELYNMKQILESCVSNRAEGTLTWLTKNDATRYYQRKDDEKRDLKYLGRKDREKIVLLAEKYRNKKYITVTEEEISQLEKSLKHLSRFNSKSDTEKVWENLPDQIRNLIEPVPLTDEEYARKWQNKKCRRKKTVEESPYITMKGEYVRSKSECIIADRLYMKGIPYHYEVNHTLVDAFGEDYNVQPDFTVLNKRTRQEFIWEHLGKLGDDDYCRDNLSKINDYVRNGYMLGKNLILSFESLNSPLNALYVNTMIDQYLL